MIPLQDDNPTELTPVVTVTFILICVLVFLYQASLPPPHAEAIVFQYGAIPALLFGQADLPPSIAIGIPAYATLLTSMFWHGGWLHLIGNMLYLWIFGDNVEDRLGHLRFLFFYIAAGAAAGLTQVALNPTSTLPTVGASGAIAGVLGAYLITFPRSRVLTFIPVFFLPWFVEIPAFVYLVFWF